MWTTAAVALAVSGAVAAQTRAGGTPPPVRAAAQSQARDSGRSAPLPPAIELGRTVRGSVAPASNVCGTPDPRMPSWSITLPANSRIQAVMTADDFDTMLEIGRYEGCEWISLGQNDDGGGPNDGLNSRLIANIRDAGTYILRGTALADSGSGAYALTVTQLPPAARTPEPIPIALGSRAEGRLTQSDASLPNDGDSNSLVDSGRPYRLYSFSGRAGDRYELTLRSSEFDSFLEVGTMTPLGFSTVQSNDDGGKEGDNLNSRVVINFATDGTVLARVSPLGPATGRYTLSLDRAKAEETTTRRPRSPRGGGQ